MNPTQPDKTVSPEPATLSEARRKLIRAGLATGPIVATLASPSVFATANCVAPSQTLSAALSHANQLGTQCDPASVESWKVTLSTATSGQPLVWKNLKFHDIFTQQSGNAGCRMFKLVNGAATPMTFNEVFQTPGITITWQFIAAYLNVCSGKVRFPVGGSLDTAKSAQTIVDMWNEWALKSSYTPYAGASAWGGDKVLAYLTNFLPSKL